MESPDSVKRVTPPITTINPTMAATAISHNPMERRACGGRADKVMEWQIAHVPPAADAARRRKGVDREYSAFAAAMDGR